MKIDITGKKFGKLLVIKKVSKIGEKNSKWLCLCECGEETEVFLNGLRRGTTKSCGCISIEKLKERATTHGLSKSKLYNVYRAMLNRCYYKKHISYKNYGGRGVTVCEEWLDKEKGFINFYEWSIKNRYIEGMDLEKDIKCKKLNIFPCIYSPDTCMWTTRKENSSNTRSNVFLEYEGENLSITEWSERIGEKKPSNITRRIKRGWTIGQALKYEKRKRTCKRTSKTTDEFAEYCMTAAQAHSGLE